MNLWPQPLYPMHGAVLSAAVAAIPLALVLILMGWLRKPGYVSAAAGLLSSLALACGVWHMPVGLALWLSLIHISLLWVEDTP